ncbi:hypothetical protein Lfu02_40570 [Longispora fulva]|uniref:Uncharacterized protein n=1 Tax=Longispora fulva TaxID=619741 RepID=A0A8J7KFR1_9ACTN|nr:hypothetical protein [Longispora fulva]MBG6136515.1 hypothetical protein [Longispora fulva]GIG59685.1 hypothetical protein Lfu02_40570 [Longispora fulva]
MEFIVVPTPGVKSGPTGSLLEPRWLLNPLLDLHKRIASNDQSTAQGMRGTDTWGGPTIPPSPQRLSDRLPPDAIPTMISMRLGGATIQVFADKFGISRSSVKNMLQRHMQGFDFAQPANTSARSSF